ncbi:aliphatic sulfonate ABC transporter substrate-binding protein [Clostridium tyrobutyricum]|uniref:ABC transporter substrate-binding protein n=1 Tax=Clostridium tyrobutyricum TaxID=1519 RepID=UPI002B21934B|nr:aliphatic sulfonate ABC transporter substrate-binding protein [Clostridium tyrobutyricum]MEA5008281.1 aliphatic sulfonate ABC transporter substrate-binding protein [Clostridium tyrobutyricum]
MKKISSIISLFALIIFLITGCGNTNKSGTLNNQKQAKPKEINIGYQPGLNHALLIVAKQKGWFKDEFQKDGITVKFQSFVSGPPMIEAFAGNRLDIGQVGDQPAIQARANNIDIKAIALYGSGYLSGLLVPNGSSIKSVKDLKGKKVGVTIGSTGHILLIKLLESAGLTTKNINVINLQPPDIKTSLASKNVDAAVTWEPFVSNTEIDGTAHQIADGKNLRLDTNLIIARNSFAQRYPDIVKRILKVYEKSQKWVQSNPDEAKNIVAQDIKMQKNVLDKAFPKENFDIKFTDTVTKSLIDTDTILRKNKTIRKDVDINDLIDKSYLNGIGIN